MKYIFFFFCIKNSIIFHFSLKIKKIKNIKKAKIFYQDYLIQKYFEKFDKNKNITLRNGFYFKKI